jgi:hypothetical protein
MRRSRPAPLDGNQFPLTLAGGLRASFADVASESTLCKNSYIRKM